MVSASASAKTNAFGVAKVKVPLPVPGQPSTLLFVLKDVKAPNGKPGYVQAFNALSNSGIPY
jgi:hypothetical protein